MIDVQAPNGATLSECGCYRYALWRTIEDLMTAREDCVFIMLNPSTANATEDDPTIRRCLGFAQSWRFHRLTVVNLFAFRATDPRELLKASDPVGPENDAAILEVVDGADLVVCAWGGFAFDLMRLRAMAVVERLRALGVVPHHLGLTKSRQPKHPLYLRGDLQPAAWRGPL